jgi:HlyD family secretion protein
MSLSKRMFRESALERLSSPEQLDQQLQVTSARGWIALTAIWALLAAIILWSIVGTVATKEAGQGIIVTGGRLKEVQAEGDGRLDDILVEAKETVEAGQLVAIIDKQDLVDEIEELSSQFDELHKQHKRHLDFDQEEAEMQAALTDRETVRLEKIIKFSTDRLARLGERQKTVTELVKKGNMSPTDSDDVAEDLEKAALEREKAMLEIDQLKARIEEESFRRLREQMKRDHEIDELEGRISVLQSRLERESTVVAPVAGRVLEVRAAEQTAVKRGDPILLIEPAGADELEVILFVSAATGKRINVGYKVHISPSTVKREEHGSMKGEIVSIADAPTTRTAMLAVLTDNDLVERFLKEIGTPLMAEVKLLTKENFDGDRRYEWTSDEGPPTRISAGTLCSGTVTVEEQRPFQLVVPMIKKKLGSD